ncbi:Z-ring formation inhibitor MciZ [Niallia circulans]
MKVYIQEKGIILSGKAWEIRYILKNTKRNLLM